MRRILYISDIEQIDKKEINRLVGEIVNTLVEYLDEYKPKLGAGTYSKHSIMGPAGKLISVLMSGKLENKDAILGYIINIHKNTSSNGYVSPTAIEKLNRAMDLFVELRKKTTTRLWIKLLREIDYAVFKRRFELIVSKGKK